MNCMRKRIRRIGVFQTAKLSSVLYGAMGLLAVPFILVASMLAPRSTGLPGLGLGVIGSLMLPVIYAVFGFIFTALACAVYIIAASAFGGIEFELEDVPPRAGATY